MWYAPLHGSALTLNAGGAGGSGVVVDPVCTGGYVWFQNARGTGVWDLSSSVANFEALGLDYHHEQYTGINVELAQNPNPVTVAIDNQYVYYPYAGNSNWSGDYVYGQWEFLNEAGEVQGAIDIYKNSTFSLRFKTGATLATATEPAWTSASYGKLRGLITFEEDGIYWKYWNTQSTVYSAQDHKISSGTNVTHIRFSNMRTKATYSASGSAGSSITLKNWASCNWTMPLLDQTADPDLWTLTNSSAYTFSDGVIYCTDRFGGNQTATQSFSDGRYAYKASWEFRVTDDGIGDATSFSVTGLGGFGPMRERLVDSQQRPNTGGVYFGSKVTLGQWYRVELERISATEVLYNFKDADTRDMIHTVLMPVTEAECTALTFSCGDGSSYSNGMDTEYRNINVHFMYSTDPNEVAP